MDHDFERCNSYIFFDGRQYRYANNEEILLRQELYRKAGLIPDIEHDLFVRNDYGALVYICGKCCNLEDAMWDASKFDNFYDFSEKIKLGYKFVIGPGIHYNCVKGLNIFNDYAVYCSNYLDILDKQYGI